MGQSQSEYSDNDMASVKEIVDSAIASNDVMMFSKSYCPYCDMAKQALKEAGVEDYEVMEMENRKDCSQMQDYLKKITGARSVPRVFIHGKCIGGGSEAKALQKSGKLIKMIKKS